jgi:hypothetical protein
VPSSYPSKRNFAFGWHTPNTFLPQTPISLSSGFQTGPYHTSVIGNGSSRYATTNSDTTPVRGRWVQTGMNDITREIQTQGKRGTRHGVAGRYLIRESGQENCKSIEPTRINGNIDPHYPATSPRKMPQGWRGVQERDIVQPKFSKDNFELAEITTRTFNGTGNSREKPAVSDIRMRLFGGRDLEQPAPQDNPSIKAVGASKPTPRKGEMPFPTLSFHGARNINPLPFSMVAFEPGPTNTRPVPNDEERRCLASQTHARPGVNSSAIGDQIKLFESRLEPASNRSMKIKNSPPKRSGGSVIGQRKRAFEDIRDGGNAVHGFWQGLSTTEIKNIVKELQELQEMEIGGKMGKRYTLAAGKWKISKAPDPTLNQRPIEMMMDGAEDATDMIVREAECGLKEPKPLRLTETRSIIWMCRRQLVTPPLGRRAILEPQRREP